MGHIGVGDTKVLWGDYTVRWGPLGADEVRWGEKYDPSVGYAVIEWLGELSTAVD